MNRTVKKRSSYDAIQRQTLLGTATEAILFALDYGVPKRISHQNVDPALLVVRASFVTLRHGERLRGCIGSLLATEALIDNVAHNAYRAAFKDSRFPPLTYADCDNLSVHISVLATPEPMRFHSEQQLLEQLQPGVDGLVLSDGARRGTFLPAVWQQLPEPTDFLNQLKRKAGLPVDYWSRSLRIERYTVEEFGGRLPVLEH